MGLSLPGNSSENTMSRSLRQLFQIIPESPGGGGGGWLTGLQI